jgi:hypothetical protein
MQVNFDDSMNAPFFIKFNLIRIIYDNIKDIEPESGAIM